MILLSNGDKFRITKIFKDPQEDGHVYTGDVGVVFEPAYETIVQSRGWWCITYNQKFWLSNSISLFEKEKKLLEELKYQDYNFKFDINKQRNNMDLAIIKEK